MRPSASAIFGLAALVAALGASGRARAGEPALTLEARDTTDYWRNLQGGIAVGDTTLNKLQVALTFDGEGAGLSGFRAYVQVFKTNAETLSLSRTGDIQTSSNIEAPGSGRLFELWVEQSRGLDGQAGWASARAGIVDLNRTFDTISTAGLFLNSSHGIGPDLSKSGLGGPSIFPDTAPGAQAGWRPIRTLVLNVGAFAEPDPNLLSRFADLSISHGVLAIGQADWTPARDEQLSLGLWRYSSRQPSLADPTVSLAPRVGVYGFGQGPTGLPGRPRTWIRAGLADGRTQAVSAYMGGGLVWNGPGPRRDLDQFGVAVGRAVIGRTGRRSLDLPHSETTFEATYSFAVNGYLTLQPDIQRIIHPAGAPRLRDATVIGLRVAASVKRTRGGD